MSVFAGSIFFHGQAYPLDFPISSLRDIAQVALENIFVSHLMFGCLIFDKIFKRLTARVWACG